MTVSIRVVALLCCTSAVVAAAALWWLMPVQSTAAQISELQAPATHRGETHSVGVSPGEKHDAEVKPDSSVPVIPSDEPDVPGAVTLGLLLDDPAKMRAESFYLSDAENAEAVVNGTLALAVVSSEHFLRLQDDLLLNGNDAAGRATTAEYQRIFDSHELTHSGRATVRALACDARVCLLRLAAQDDVTAAEVSAAYFAQPGRYGAIFSGGRRASGEYHYLFTRPGRQRD